MTREQINSILAESGIENKAVTSALLSAFNEEKRNAVVEAANKALDDFRDWKSPEEYAELETQLKAEKESTAKAGRVGKLKEAKINPKWLDYADEKLKDAKDYDKALAEFVKENPELLAKDEPKPTTDNSGQAKTTSTNTTPVKQFEFGNTKSGTPKPDAPSSMHDAVAEYYAAKNGK